tara:strand:- start:454 stop:636 length:183 start_codon:yes stop_codon:yes gene_type:complete
VQEVLALLLREIMVVMGATVYFLPLPLMAVVGEAHMLVVLVEMVVLVVAVVVLEQSAKGV